MKNVVMVLKLKGLVNGLVALGETSTLDKINEVVSKYFPSTKLTETQINSILSSDVEGLMSLAAPLLKIDDLVVVEEAINLIGSLSKEA